MDIRVNELLGSGPVFPFQIVDGKMVVSTGKDLIKGSIVNILSWHYSRRYFLGQYGSKIENLLEKPTDFITLEMVRDYVIDSITRWEKRIELISVETVVQNETVLVYLKYQIKVDNSTDSFIIPFYSQIRH